MLKYYGVDFEDIKDVKDLINIGLQFCHLSAINYYVENGIDDLEFKFENLVANENLLDILTENALRLFDNNFSHANKILSREELFKYLKGNILLLSNLDPSKGITFNNLDNYEESYKYVTDFILNTDLVSMDKYLFFDEDTYMNVNKVTSEEEFENYWDEIESFAVSLGAELPDYSSLPLLNLDDLDDLDLEY